MGFTRSETKLRHTLQHQILQSNMNTADILKDLLPKLATKLQWGLIPEDASNRKTLAMERQF